MNSLIGSTTLGDDYKALVCILLNGGNDSFNMVVPRGAAEYNEYSSIRSNQAINQQDLLPINPTTSDGKDYGLHPALPDLQLLFEQGNLAIINNVGTLVEPVTVADVQGSGANIPLGLFSHSDQQMHWQTALPQSRTIKGWGGKMADILKSMNTNQDISMNISLRGNNVFQRGDTVTPYAITSEGGVAIQGWTIQDPFFDLVREDVTDMMNKAYEDVFKDSYRSVLKRSVDSNELFNAAIEGVDLTTDFSNTRLSQDLRMVARSIAARDQLGAKRQIFFVQLGGFDNHDELLNTQGLLLQQVNNAMSEFYTALQSIGAEDCVTTFTISDFARTLTSNGNGTDHAWGGNALVMGGAVKGKEMYGSYPSLALNGNQIWNNSVVVPTASADLYFAELALWFGISPNDLSLILPNIGEFYNTGSGIPPMEFLL